MHRRLRGKMTFWWDNHRQRRVKPILLEMVQTIHHRLTHKSSTESRYKRRAKAPSSSKLSPTTKLVIMANRMSKLLHKNGLKRRRPLSTISSPKVPILLTRIRQIEEAIENHRLLAHTKRMYHQLLPPLSSLNHPRPAAIWTQTFHRASSTNSKLSLKITRSWMLFTTPTISIRLWKNGKS